MVASDAAARSELVALTAEAAVSASVRAPDACRREWPSAPLVLAHASAEVLDILAGLPRRDAVLLAVPSSATGPDAGTWRRALAVGAEHVAVLPADREALVDRLRRVATSRLAVCVGVVGARGGSGATSAAVALAGVGATHGAETLLVDADPLGGGLDVVLGAERLPGLRWPDLDQIASPIPEGGLAAALPSADGVALLSHARRSSAVTGATAAAVLGAATSEYDLVVVDLPRWPDDLARHALSVLDVLVVVCPAEVRASVAVARVLDEVAVEAGVRIRLLVRGPSPSGLALPAVAEAVRASGAAVPAATVACVRAEPGLAAALDRGEPFAVGARSPLRRWARALLAAETALPVRGRVAGAAAATAAAATAAAPATHRSGNRASGPASDTSDR